MTITTGEAASRLLAALTVLRDRVAGVRLPLPTPAASEADRLRHDVVAQLDDYVLPRLREIDAPVLAVVGGSTGAGKSTLVNSLVGQPVSETGVLRPTTRSPVLVHHPGDTPWFEGDRVLPGLPRVTGSAADPGSLLLVAADTVPVGLALLDAPDVDSVVAENRELAAQLLAAADLWLFVTSAARYADAVPWELLRGAAARSAAVAVVLDRVPPDAAGEVTPHLAAMLASHGLGEAPLFVVLEVTVGDDGLLPADAVADIDAWLRELAGDAAARADVVRRTLDGAVEGLARRVPTIAAAADEQVERGVRLRDAAVQAYADGVDEVDAAMRDGTVLRGEVLARWQDFVGTGEFFRSLEEQVGRVRDRVAAVLRGRPAPGAEVEVAIEHGLQSLLVDAAERSADRTDRLWRSDAAGTWLLEGAALSRASDDLADRAAATVRAWQGAVLDLVRTEGQDKRTSARFMSLGVNGLGLALMIVVFASTGGLTGAEVGIAGGTAVVGQRLLEAVFGDQAVRRLAEQARADLRRRTRALFTEEAERFTDLLDHLDLDQGAAASVVDAVNGVDAARISRGWIR
ncbi:MAG TPA: GTPase domain-containing protein [Jiangellales bacterium]|nr:GTPase domain-containing protein [Jiangellales bacterium]